MSETAEGVPPEGRRLSWTSSALLWVYGFTLLWVDLGRGWVITYHENLFAGGAREFLREGNWLIPRYLGSPIMEYPPLTQWIIALSMTIFRSDAEWVARLPITLAAILNAWMIASLAARWQGERIGRLAGLIQLTTFYNLMQARLAESDMILTTAVTAAMTSLALGVIARADGSKPSRWLPIAYFAATAAAFLAKGPIGPAFIALGTLAYTAFDRRREVVRFSLDPIGWALLLSVTLGWMYASYLSHPQMLAQMRENILDRFTTGKAMKTDGRENLFFYAYMVLFLLLPWTPWTIAGAWRAPREGGRRMASWTFLGCWFGAGFVLLSASAFKHKHYAIPILPPLSVVAAYGLARHTWGRRPGAYSAAITASIAAVGVAAIAVASRFSEGQRAVILGSAAMVGVAGAGIALSFHLRRRGRPARSLVMVFGSLWIVVLILRSAILPEFDIYRPEAALALRVNTEIQPGAPLYIVGSKYTQLSYYLRPPLVHYESYQRFKNLLDSTPPDVPVYAIAPANMVDKFRILGEVKVLEVSGVYKNMTVMELDRRGGDVATRARKPPVTG